MSLEQNIDPFTAHLVKVQALSPEYELSCLRVPAPEKTQVHVSHERLFCSLLFFVLILSETESEYVDKAGFPSDQRFSLVDRATGVQTWRKTTNFQ